MARQRAPDQAREPRHVLRLRARRSWRRASGRTRSAPRRGAGLDRARAGGPGPQHRAASAWSTDCESGVGGRDDRCVDGLDVALLRGGRRCRVHVSVGCARDGVCRPCCGVGPSAGRLGAQGRPVGRPRRGPSGKYEVTRTAEGGRWICCQGWDEVRPADRGVAVTVGVMIV